MTLSFRVIWFWTVLFSLLCCLVCCIIWVTWSMWLFRDSRRSDCWSLTCRGLVLWFCIKFMRSLNSNYWLGTSRCFRTLLTRSILFIEAIILRIIFCWCVITCMLLWCVCWWGWPLRFIVDGWWIGYMRVEAVTAHECRRYVIALWFSVLKGGNISLLYDFWMATFLGDILVR